MALNGISAPSNSFVPKGKARETVLKGRALGAATNAITLQAGESSTGLAIAYAGSAGQYTLTLPGRGGLDLGAVHVTYEGTDTLAARVLSRSESARTVTFEVVDETGTAQSLIAAQYLNFSVTVYHI